MIYTARQLFLFLIAVLLITGCVNASEEVVKKHIKAHFQSKQFFRDKISEEDVKGYFDKAGYSAEFKTVEEAKEPILQKLVQKAINNYVQDELKSQVKYVQVS